MNATLLAELMSAVAVIAVVFVGILAWRQGDNGINVDRLNTLTTGSDVLRNELAVEREKTIKLTQQVGISDRLCQEAQADAKAARDQVNKLSGSFEVLSLQFKDLSEKYDHLMDENGQLKGEKRMLELEVKGLRKEVANIPGNLDINAIDIG